MDNKNARIRISDLQDLFFRSCLNRILFFKYPNQSSVKCPILSVGKFSSAKISFKYHHLFKHSFKINIHVFVVLNMAFEFSKFVFSIRLNQIFKALILLRDLHLTLKTEFWNDNVPSKALINFSRHFPGGKDIVNIFI